MGSTALMACLMASPIALFMLIVIIKQRPAYEEDYEQRPSTEKEDQNNEESSPRAPNVIAIDDIRALAGIAEHPSIKRFRT